MIKPLNSPQLSSAKPRTGMNSIAELLPRLIRQYELQAELAKQQSIPTPVPPVMNTAHTQQATFAWYE